jgi:hypothetical protein
VLGDSILLEPSTPAFQSGAAAMANEDKQQPQVGKDGAKKGDGPSGQPEAAQSDSQKLHDPAKQPGMPQVGRVTMGNNLASAADVKRAQKDAESGGVVLEAGESPFKDGKLTRESAEKIINGGGSVMINGETIANVDELPSAAEFAKGDEAQEKAVLESLDRQQERLDRERAALRGKK